MKFLTTNFVQCTVPSCARSSNAFPLKYQDCELVQKEVDFNPELVASILTKVDWNALKLVAQELGNNALPSEKPELSDAVSEQETQLLKDLHSLLFETNIEEGSMVCRNCDHIYYIKSSIPNFLLPPHLS